MATATVNYGSSTSITLNLASLSNNTYRQSTVVDNSSNKYVDALVGGSFQAGTSPTDKSTVEIYAYGERDDAGNYTAGCSGSDGTYTADGEEDELKLVEIVTVDATSDQDYEWGPVAIARAFGGVLPRKWGIVIKNATGAAFNSTGSNNETKYQGIKFDIA
jgi:hypothetical protein